MLTEEKILDLAYENKKLKHKLMYIPNEIDFQPPKHRLWEHKKTGKCYYVVNVVTNEADLKQMIAYETAKYPYIVFVRPYTEFVEKFEEVQRV